MDKSAIIKTASLISLFGNFVLAIAKISVGIISGSMAVIGDGIDTSVDVLISIMTLFVAVVIARPADKEHPYGHGRAETIATVGLSFVLFFAGLQLVFNSGRFLISGEHRQAPSLPAIFVTIISIAVKLLLALNQYIMGKKARSAMLKANAQNMTADVVVSGAVLVGITLSIYFDIGAIDAVAALFVGFWVIKAAVCIFREANTELMDGCSCEEQYKVIFEAVRSVDGAWNPHRTRIRSIAGFLDIDVDVEVDGALTVREAHDISIKIETAIRERVENVFDVMVHIEPYGEMNQRESEAYGLSESALEK
ncbi:MAG: cation diffusion facilitator family transporter [Spirochaetaceae bacterium]|jgi:cation diffusion facilitator family transporter|nr:cation diffusion facilitator family transporter [Spirochaetaceae bacterium]